MAKGNLDDFGQCYPVRGMKTGEEVVEAVTWDDIQKLKTAFFYNAIMLYNNWKRFGLPHGGGWAAERASVIDALGILDGEANAFDAWEMEKGRR